MREIFHGWWIVAAVGIILTFSSGLGFYNHAVMLQALVVEKSFPMTASSMAVSVFFLTSGLTGPVVARLMERFDVRAIMTTGALIAAASLAGIGFVDTLAELYGVYILFGVGFAASGLLPGTALVTRWFERRRAFALAVASTGLSVGGVVITPLSATFIESVGISTATPWLGLAFLLGTAPVCLLFIRSSPAEMGLRMDGAAPAGGAEPVPGGIVYEAALRTRFFWATSVSYFFVMMAQVGSIAHQFGLVREQLDARQAALALAILPVFSVIGRLAGGWIVDRVSITAFTTGMMVAQCAALMVLSMDVGVWPLLLGLAFFGITVGNLLMLQPLLIAAAFGLVHYGRIYALSQLLTTFGVALGPAVMGAVAEATSGFSGAYGAATVAALVSVVIFAVAGPMPRVAER